MEPAPVAAPRTRLRLLTATKVVVSAGLLYWVLSRSNLGEVLAAAGSAHVGLLLFAYSLHLVGLYLSATRWKGLLRAQSIEASTVFLMKSFLVGSFFNQFLPSTVGGDASRAYDSYRLGNKKASAMTSVVVDRLLGLLALMTFAVMALPFSHQITNRIPLLPLWVGVGAAGIGMTVWMGSRKRLLFVRWVSSSKMPSGSTTAYSSLASCSTVTRVQVACPSQLSRTS